MRTPRPITALVAVGTAVLAIGLPALPASADQVRSEQWWLKTLDVAPAWAATQGYGVTVAVLSDGVDATHPDLAGALAAAPAPGPADAPAATGQYAGQDGTGIASLIAGRGHGSGGGSGVTGIAPAASILSVPVTLPAGDPALAQAATAAAIPDAIAAGIRYAVANGASVIDLPVDPAQPSSAGAATGGAGAGGSDAEQSAVSYALAHDVVLVAPAGDDAATTDAPNYPAAYQGVIAVGAFDSDIQKAPWSSRQPYVTLTAPGEGVVAAANTGQYQTMNSTSAASAMVAGAAALIRSRYPALPVADVTKALTSGSSFQHDGDAADGSGSGVLDVGKALAAAATLAAPAAQAAGANAEPATSPGAAGPAAPGSSSSVISASDLTSAGEKAAALLVLLLLAIAVYRASARRRQRRGAPAAATGSQWAQRQPQSRYPTSTTSSADRMLEIFATPLQAPAGPRLSPPGSSPAAPRTVRPPLGQPADAPLAAARRPVVTGAPPWEPATPPAGDFTWNSPGRPGPSPALADREPAWSVAPAAAGLPAPPAGPRPGPRQPGWRPGSALHQPAAGSPGPARAGYDFSPAPLAAPPASPVPAAGPDEPAWPAPAAAPPAAAPAAGPPASPGQPGLHRSGLPIRQPRKVTAGTSTSGGGSIWDRPATRIQEPLDPAGGPPKGYFPGDSGPPRRAPAPEHAVSRPIFAWQDGHSADDAQPAGELGWRYHQDSRE